MELAIFNWWLQFNSPNKKKTGCFNSNTSSTFLMQRNVFDFKLEVVLNLYKSAK